MKPKIAITFSKNELPTDAEYLEAVKEAGGDPVAVRPGVDIEVSEFHGLLLSGGGDVDPEFYGEPKESFCDEPEQDRDQLELSLLKKFLEEDKPVFAICRGAQVVNVGLGGSLYQDITAQVEQDPKITHHAPNGASREEKRAIRHSVDVKIGSQLEKLLGEHFDVNSRHHQALKKLAPSLLSTAESEDGLIEAFESKEHTWLLGVQWHPESIEVRSAFVPLFQQFVEECSLMVPAP